jgi:hypothetical protein
MDGTCKHCGGSKDVRNPTGNCDHLFWPENLSDEARRANGLKITLPVLANAPSEFYVNGLRFDPGMYEIKRIGPPDEANPPF